MMINALNSGARVFMADLEDAISPTGRTSSTARQRCIDAVRRTHRVRQPGGQEYRLNDADRDAGRPAARLAPGREHLLRRRRADLGSLFDFGLYVFHNARELLERGAAPYFYLPKLESHLEARLWNDVVHARPGRRSGIPRGTIRATVLIETILAAFEMDEILYELREHSAGAERGPLGLHLQRASRSCATRPSFCPTARR